MSEHLCMMSSISFPVLGLHQPVCMPGITIVFSTYINNDSLNNYLLYMCRTFYWSDATSSFKVEPRYWKVFISGCGEKVHQQWCTEPRGSLPNTENGFPEIELRISCGRIWDKIWLYYSSLLSLMISYWIEFESQWSIDWFYQDSTVWFGNFNLEDV